MVKKTQLLHTKNQGFEMFDSMIEDIREYTASSLFRAKVKINVVPTAPKGPVAMGRANKTEKSTAKNKDVHIGRNNMCPCGSGKKYKNCCGINKG